MALAETFFAEMGGPLPGRAPLTIEEADADGLTAHATLRRRAFVDVQGLFDGHDGDGHDLEPTTVVLVARDGGGAVVAGVRLHPHPDHPELGWWQGSRLVCAPGTAPGVAPALIRAATATATARGALRFDATVQPDKRLLFERLGWSVLAPTEVNGRPHLLMVAADDRVARTLEEHKRPLGRLFADLAPGGRGFVGDDAAPVPGVGMVAACDAVLPAMVERDPWWAGWCAVLVNVNDLAAMGATPVGLLDAVAARSEEHVRSVVAGVTDAADAFGVPVLGGHTQLGQHAALSITALGATDDPIPSGGGCPGDHLSLIVDTSGSWRPGYGGRQWDSTSGRSPDELRAMTRLLAGHRPHAAKDVSMAGTIGSLAMLAEASGTGAEVDVACVPRPATAELGEWLGCFPGFALLTADRPGRRPPPSPATTAAIGRLTTEVGVVRLRWPDGLTTVAVDGPATGLGAS
jgi:putative N-acetyltransferase (TIGR04045 family)